MEADAASLGAVLGPHPVAQGSDSPQHHSPRAEAGPSSVGHLPSDQLQTVHTASHTAPHVSSTSEQGSAESSRLVGSSTQQLPANLSMLQFARQTEADRYQKKPKLESFDKIIGRPPNTPHHVTLQAAPTQKAYLPQWLASPLGMQRTTSVIPKLHPKASGDPVSASRFTTEDTEVQYAPPKTLHRDASYRVMSPPQQRHCHQAQLHQDDPNQAYTPPQPVRASAVGSGTNPFATLSHSAFSPDRHKPPPGPLTRAASEATICRSNSVASLSPALHKGPPIPYTEADATEPSFVSLHLETVRPTAPKPYQTGHFARPGSAASTVNRFSPASGGMQRARSLDTRPSTSSSSGGPSPGVASPPMRYPSFAGDRAAEVSRHSSRHSALLSRPLQLIHTHGCCENLVHDYGKQCY